MSQTQELENEDAWLALRDTALTPLSMSELVSTEQTRLEFVEGCRLLGLTRVYPHQLLLADMLNAEKETNGVLLPRQSGKTKTMAIITLGRCSLRERYNAAFTMTTLAGKSSEVFVMSILEELQLAFPDPDDRPFRIYRGRGSEYAYFPNGSRFAVKSPKGTSFRGSSYDLVWLDEGGEADPEQGEDLRAAIYSTFDTRDGAQLVVTGTAGTYRDGQLLWGALEGTGNGVVRYAFPEDTTEDELASWTPTEEEPYGHVRELVEAMHPGIACGLTTIEKVQKRYDDSTVDRFAREYGGIFGQVGQGLGAFDLVKWADSGQDAAPAVPEHWALGAMPSFTGSSAALVAAWRDKDGKAHGYLLDHRKGTTWLAEAAAEQARIHSIPVVYDSKSSDMRVEVEVMQRMDPTPGLAPQVFNDVTTAAALLVKDINNGNAIHYNQPIMTDAVRKTVRRSTGPNSWAFGRPPRDTTSDISPVEAWALALRYYDAHPHSEMVFVAIAA